jgi:LuxR family maltose regulon positive regulatory protein
VSRPRLAARLTEAVTGELTMVCAPAGFGKTALLADWAQRSGRPVAWLSLDAGDNDPVRFWQHVTAALGDVRDGVRERLAPLLGPPSPRSFEAVVTTLVNELVTAPDELVLVLDDYHLIEAPAVHESMVFLLEHLPAGLSLAVACRADPPLPLARLRASGELAELRAAELRFTLEEATALLHEAVGPDLPADAVEALEARSEGWVTGLQLAALSLRGRADVAGFVAAFSGSHRYVLDYLAEEVLDRQPEPVRTFLLETSVLDRLCGPLCDAVTGRTDGQRLLEAVERANLFLTPLDEVRGWWRYHQLFADLLRVCLMQERPESLPELHRAAAGWCDQHGLVDDAVRHALAAGDTAWAARMMEQHIGGMPVGGETATVARWLAVLPATVVHDRPRLCVVQAYQAVMTSRADALERWLDAADRALSAVSAGEPAEAEAGPAKGWTAGWQDVPGIVAVLRADLARLRGDADRAAQLARQVLTRAPTADNLGPFFAGWILARADWLRGDLGAAEHALTNLVGTVQAAREYYLTMAVCWELGRVQCAQGRLGAALATYRHALIIGAEAGNPALPVLGIAELGEAAVRYERDDLAAAHEHATEGMSRVRQMVGTRLEAEGLIVLARIRQALGDQAGALAAVAEAERVGPSPDVVDLFNPAPAARARLLLAEGQLAEVAAWAAMRGLDAEHPPGFAREREHMILARLLLGQGEPERARRLAEQLRDAAAAQRRTGSLIELGPLLARARAACGDQAGALAALAEALTLAWPEGYVRVFADEGAPLAGLLDQLITGRRRGAAAAAGVPGEYLSRVRAAFEPDRSRAVVPAPAPAPAVTAGLAEPLTDRELEVLGLLAAGLANKQIAGELVVAPETAKKHVSHILAKLGAANRTQAVMRARELGLLRLRRWSTRAARWPRWEGSGVREGPAAGSRPCRAGSSRRSRRASRRRECKERRSRSCLSPSGPASARQWRRSR